MSLGGNATASEALMRARAVTTAYRFGYYNYGEDRVNYMPDAVNAIDVHEAYELGRAQRNADTAARAEEEAVRTRRAPMRKGGGSVIFENVKGEYHSGTLQGESIRFLRHFAKAAGKDIHLYESTVKDGKRSAEVRGKKVTANGFFIDDSGEIWVDVNSGAGGKGLVLYTTAHELVHYIRSRSAADFDMFADFVVQTYMEKGVNADALVAAKMKEQGLSYDAAFEEVIADSAQNVLTDGRVAEKLAEFSEGKDEGFARRIINAIRRVVESIKKKLGMAENAPQSFEGRFFTEAGKTLEDMEDLFALALKRSLENEARETVTAERGAESETVRYSIRKTVNIPYSEQIEGIESGTLNGSNSLYIGKLSNLSKAGFSDAPFAMNQGDYRKSRRGSASNTHRSSHNVSRSVMQRLPRLLDSAVMFIDNGDKVTVITSEKMADTKGNPSLIIAGVRKDFDMFGDMVNLVKSIYPFDDISDHIAKAAENGKFVVTDKNKAQDILVRSIGIQTAEGTRILNLARDSLSQKNAFVKGENPEDRKYQQRGTITPDTSDSEREAILRGAVMEVEEYEGEADAAIEKSREHLESRERSVIKKTLARLGDQFGIYKDYRNDDFDMTISMSRGTMKESGAKALTDPKQIAKLLPKIETAIKDAVGLEVHQNRYFYDQNTVAFAELLGGYTEGENFIPVRFGVKITEKQGNRLYVIVDEEQIKKDRVVKPFTPKSFNLGKSGSRLSTISIPRILENVNSKDILRYVPDGFLSEDKKKLKYEAIAETVKYTNDKNDEMYRKYIEAGDKRSAENMVEAAAKAAGYDEVWYHGTNASFTKYDLSKNKPYHQNYGEGIYLAKTKEQARMYGDNIYKFFVKKGLYWRDAKKLGAKKGYSLVNDGRTMIVYDPNQIKLADPITYDDNNNIIPISERFNEKTDDIRFQQRGISDDYSDAFDDAGAEGEERLFAEDVQALKTVLRLQNEAGGVAFTASSVELAAANFEIIREKTAC